MGICPAALARSQCQQPFSDEVLQRLQRTSANTESLDEPYMKGPKRLRTPRQEKLFEANNVGYEQNCPRSLDGGPSLDDVLDHSPQSCWFVTGIGVGSPTLLRWISLQKCALTSSFWRHWETLKWRHSCLPEARDLESGIWAGNVQFCCLLTSRP